MSPRLLSAYLVRIQTRTKHVRQLLSAAKRRRKPARP